MSNFCLKCKENEPYWLYQCCMCKKGACNACGENLRKEREKINKTAKCEFCHHEFETFCKECQDTVFNILKSEDERLAKGPEMKFVFHNNPFNDDFSARGEMKLVTPYPSPYGENRTVESVCKTLYLDRCCCDSRCECLVNSLHTAHKNQNVDFYVLDEHEGPICTACFPKQYPNGQITYNWTLF